MNNWECTKDLVRMAAAILAVVRLLSFPAQAATVPQTSASAYIFHRPLLTNNIRGVVMGWPPAYRVIRSEDLDWLWEAANERMSSAFGSTNWSDSTVGARVRENDFSALPTFWNGVTQNSSDLYDRDGWLDGDVALTDLRAFPATLVTTNVWTYPDSASVTNRYDSIWDNATSISNGFSVITMPLTNGTTSVFTNSWKWNYLTTNETRIAVTNTHVWTPLDWSQDDVSGPFPGNTNAPYRTWDTTRVPFPTVNAISNAYRALKSTVRLADWGYDATNSNVRIEYFQSDGVDDRPRTNAMQYLDYSLAVSATSNGLHYSGMEYRHVTPLTVHVPTRFKSYLNTLGGARRVELKAAYAHADLYYWYRNVFNRGQDISIHTNILIRLYDATLDTSGETMHVHAPYNAKELGSVAGVLATDVVPPIPSEGHMYRPYAGESHTWQFTKYGFLCIYRITPATRLPDW